MSGRVKVSGTSHSPHAVSEERVKCLEGVPLASGPIGGLTFLVWMPLTWLILLGILLREFVKRPLQFFSRAAPRALEELPLPAELKGLVHEVLELDTVVKLHAASFGRQPGKPLMLFLHGFPECWYSWRAQLAAFRGEYEVVALDMRGFGWSDKPQSVSEYTLGKLSADVAAAVRALGRASCTLVCHDWGGVVGWAAAGRYPGLVDRLVQVAGPHWLLAKRNMTPAQRLKSAYILMFQMPIFAELLITNTNCQLVESILLEGPGSPVNKGVATQQDVEMLKAALQQPGAPSATLAYYRALLLADVGLVPYGQGVEAALRRPLPMPVLVVWGDSDAALGTGLLRGIDEVAPRSEVHILERCSHWVQYDRPRELQRVLAEWLAANPLAGGGKAAAAAAGRPVAKAGAAAAEPAGDGAQGGGGKGKKRQ